jgi:hypothetical protein
MGCRPVAAALEKEGFGKVSKTKVAEWLRQDAENRAAVRAPAPVEASEPTDAPPKDESSLTDIAVEGLDFAELLKLDADVSGFVAKALADEDEKRFAVLVRLRMELRVQLEKMRPRPKVDPATDPTSLEARAAVLSRVKKMVENAQAAATTRPAPPRA